MHKASTLIALTLIGFGAGARAEEAAPPPPPPVVVVPVPPMPPPNAVVVQPAPPPDSARRVRRIEVGLSFVGMGLGSFTTPSPPLTITNDAEVAYGVGISASYRVIAGLSLGIAPQAIFNVASKRNPTDIGVAPQAATEYDFMARIAYTLDLGDAVGIYGEVLPGYSKISQPGTNPAAGFVLAVGGGFSMSLTDLVFTNIGVAYQMGYQSLSVAGMKYENRTDYLRFTLGGGVRF